jgi:hypothetical protein
MVGKYKKKNGFSLKKNHFTTQISRRFVSYRHFDRVNSDGSESGLVVFLGPASIFLTRHKCL